jgi:hypothetical protein
MAGGAPALLGAGLVLTAIAIFPYLVLGRPGLSMANFGSRDQILVTLTAGLMAVPAVVLLAGESRRGAVLAGLMGLCAAVNGSVYLASLRDGNFENALVARIGGSDAVAHGSTFIFDESDNPYLVMRDYTHRDLTAPMVLAFGTQTRYAVSCPHLDEACRRFLRDYLSWPNSFHEHSRDYRPDPQATVLRPEPGALRLTPFGSLRLALERLLMPQSYAAAIPAYARLAPGLVDSLPLSPAPPAPPGLSASPGG